MKVCPRCSKKYTGFPALSRRDNKTEICSSCGEDEALFDFVMNSTLNRDKRSVHWIQEKRDREKSWLLIIFLVIFLLGCGGNSPAETDAQIYCGFKRSECINSLPLISKKYKCVEDYAKCIYDFNHNKKDN